MRRFRISARKGKERFLLVDWQIVNPKTITEIRRGPHLAVSMSFLLKVYRFPQSDLSFVMEGKEEEETKKKKKSTGKDGGGRSKILDIRAKATKKTQIEQNRCFSAFAQTRAPIGWRHLWLRQPNRQTGRVWTRAQEGGGGDIVRGERSTAVLTFAMAATSSWGNPMAMDGWSGRSDGFPSWRRKVQHLNKVGKTSIASR